MAQYTDILFLGTGKSFIGGLASKMLLGSSSGCLLVLSYTNHALDQFLEDLLKIGIRESDMTRLGSKFSAATAPLSFEPQFRASKFQHGKKEKSRLYRAKEEVNDTRDEVTTMFEKTMGRVSWVDILDQLKFSDDPQEQLFWRAFEVPTEDDGFVRSGKKGKVIKEDYLINIWRQGNDPGVLQQHVSPECRPVWDIPTEERARYVEKWGKSLRAERIEGLRGLINRLNEAQGEVDFLFNEARRSFITKKRVIGCTTTAAAKYSSLIKAAKPNYVLVEEAGEIQEAHVLTALSPNTKQLILIGDHKQLRPKCNNYALSVEKGDGYDLNRSMFERLIIQGHHHVTLRTQHRMDPEISQLVRAMTYPELLDGERTNGRPLIRGINGRVAFINHDQPEVDAGRSEMRVMPVTRQANGTGLKPRWFSNLSNTWANKDTRRPTWWS